MRRAAVVVVALLAVLAGCSGLPGAPGDTSTTTAPGDGAGTTTAGDGGGDGGSGEYPPGYDKRGPTSMSTALQQHYATTQNMSYSVEFRFRRGSEFRGSLATAGERDALTATFVGEGRPSQNFYLADGTVYSRTNRPGNVSYKVAQRSYDAFRVQLTAEPLKSMGDVNWNHVGTVEQDGTTLHRYKPTGINTSRRAAPNPEAVNNLDGELLVDDRGVIYDYSLKADVDGVGPVRYEYGISSVGSATVEEPGWVSEAQSSAGSGGNQSSGNQSG